MTFTFSFCWCLEYRCLSFCTFSLDHWVVCPSSIYGFCIPHWYLQILLIYKMVRMVAMRYIIIENIMKPSVFNIIIIYFFFFKKRLLTITLMALGCILRVRVCWISKAWLFLFLFLDFEKIPIFMHYQINKRYNENNKWIWSVCYKTVNPR